MHKTNNSLKEVVTVVAKGRIKDEPLVVHCVKKMLYDVGLKSGTFNLIVTTKIKSGGIHHEGVEIRDLRRNAVRLAVQYGDNGTRFECFLSSPEFKPSHLYTLLISNPRIKGSHYRIDDECREVMFLKSKIVDEPVETKADKTHCQTLEQKIAKLKVQISELEKLKADYEKALAIQAECTKEIRRLEISITRVRNRQELILIVIERQEVVFKDFLLKNA